MAHIGIDTTQFDRQPGGDGAPLPVGIYHGIIVRIEQKQTRSGGIAVEAEFDITSPQQYTNRKFWESFNIINSSTDAQRIGREHISDLAKAAGINGVLNDDQDLLGREVMLELGIDPAKPYERDGVKYPGKERNKCLKYWPLGTDVATEKAKRRSGGVSQAVQAQPSTKPGWGAAQAAPSAAPAPSAGSAPAKPWANR